MSLCVGRAEHAHRSAHYGTVKRGLGSADSPPTQATNIDGGSRNARAPDDSDQPGRIRRLGQGRRRTAVEYVLVLVLVLVLIALALVTLVVTGLSGVIGNAVNKIASSLT